MKIGLYLAGCGSLDGSDVPAAVFTRELLQKHNHDTVVGARDVAQGESVNHRTLEVGDENRNSLDESARITRGDVRDMRKIDRSDLEGLVLVGGGGVLSTWTDFHERGSNMRITERLQFHLEAVHRRQKPILCLGNAHLPIAFTLRDETELRLGAVDRDPINDLVEKLGHDLECQPRVEDEANSILHLPEVLQEPDWPGMRQTIDQAIQRHFSTPSGPQPKR